MQLAGRQPPAGEHQHQVLGRAGQRGTRPETPVHVVRDEFHAAQVDAEVPQRLPAGQLVKQCGKQWPQLLLAMLAAKKPAGGIKLAGSSS